MTYLAVPKLVLTPVNLSEGEDISSSISELKELIRRHEALNKAMDRLENTVSLRIAEIRRAGAAELVSIEQVRELGLPLDADQTAAPFERALKLNEEIFAQVLEMVSKISSPNDDIEEVVRDVERRLRSFSARLQVELAEAARLLRDAIARSAKVSDGIGARAFRAYRDAFKSVSPDAKIGAIKPLLHHGDIMPILEVRLPKKRSAAELVHDEQVVHDIVEQADPSYSGIFGIRYLAA